MVSPHRGVGRSFWVLEGLMAVEVSQNKEICGGGKNGGRKEIGFAILWRRANWGSINIKK